MHAHTPCTLTQHACTHNMHAYTYTIDRRPSYTYRPSHIHTHAHLQSTRVHTQHLYTLHTLTHTFTHHTRTSSHTHAYTLHTYTLTLTLTHHTHTLSHTHITLSCTHFQTSMYQWMMTCLKIYRYKPINPFISTARVNYNLFSTVRQTTIIARLVRALVHV